MQFNKNITKHQDYAWLEQKNTFNLGVIQLKKDNKELQKELNDDISIIFEENANRSAAYKDGELIGECEFSVSDNIWTIYHTGVRPAFEGKGIARKLLEKVIEFARLKKLKIIPQCSYAAKIMVGKEEYKDVL